MNKFILFLSFFVVPALASEDCLEITEQQMTEWQSVQPQMPSLPFLFQAKKLIDAERNYSLTLGNDKRAHCYLGCRIGETVNFDTAHFIAWQKEYNDATDCNPKTHFEIADYEATIKGALREGKISVKKKVVQACTAFCKKTF